MPNIQYWLRTTQVPEDAWTMDDQLAVPWDTNIVQKTIYNRENNFTREKAPLVNSFVLSWAATFCNQGRYYFRISFDKLWSGIVVEVVGNRAREIVQQFAQNCTATRAQWRTGFEVRMKGWWVQSAQMFAGSTTWVSSTEMWISSLCFKLKRCDVHCTCFARYKPLDACAEEVWGHFIPRQSVPRHISSRDNICPGTLCCGTKCPQTCSTRGHRRRMILSMLDSFAADRYYGNGKEISGFAEE